MRSPAAQPQGPPLVQTAPNFMRASGGANHGNVDNTQQPQLPSNLSSKTARVQKNPGVAHTPPGSGSSAPDTCLDALQRSSAHLLRPTGPAVTPAGRLVPGKRRPK